MFIRTDFQVLFLTYGVDWDGPSRADDENTDAVLYHKQTALFYQQNWWNFVHCM